MERYFPKIPKRCPEGQGQPAAKKTKVQIQASVSGWVAAGGNGPAAGAQESKKKKKKTKRHHKPVSLDLKPETVVTAALKAAPESETNAARSSSTSAAPTTAPVIIPVFTTPAAVASAEEGKAAVDKGDIDSVEKVRMHDWES
ncbi:hypothetical protein LCI18_007394 [Fusarium solani-melongenae]|uniref:Uncharacterized protein n=1 Tax=Fusarium solani subsp. cucurbitae TaxID=2747967 RepID=A0ACD3Z5C6_FUSSC|nr:hypothetical protein LCI18_007394 [Fusarium solani-melongenae]